jgi:hypothetical protein
LDKDHEEGTCNDCNVPKIKLFGVSLCQKNIPHAVVDGVIFFFPSVERVSERRQVRCRKVGRGENGEKRREVGGRREKGGAREGKGGKGKEGREGRAIPAQNRKPKN